MNENDATAASEAADKGGRSEENSRDDAIRCDRIERMNESLCFGGGKRS